jgi:hypothetical protein
MAIRGLLPKAMTAVLLVMSFAAPRSAAQAQTMTAAEVIDKYFDAIGGRDRIEGIDDLVIGGYYGNVYLVRGDSMTLYLKKPRDLRRESYGRIVTFDGEHGYINSFGELTEAEGDNLTSLRYYAGFFHNCFSLLKFGDALDDAVYLGERRLGPQLEHVISIPYEGTDYEVHFLADSFLLDRIVFPFGETEQGTRMVNALKDYKEFSGVTMPTVLTFDVVGREAAGMRLDIALVDTPASLPDSLFEKPEIVIKPPTLKDGVLTGFIYDDQEGNILTNIRKENMEELGIEPGQFMTFQVAGDTMSVRYVENIHTGFKGAQLGDYIAIYYQAPLLTIIMFGEGALSDVFHYEKGQEIKVWITKGSEQ